MKKRNNILPPRVIPGVPRTSPMPKPPGSLTKAKMTVAPSGNALMAASKKKPVKGGLSARAAADAAPDSAKRKINKTSGPRAGMSYVETTDALGRKVHDYGAEGVFVVPKKKRKGLSVP